MSNTYSSPLAIQGIRLATTASGIRYKNRDDLCLIEVDANTKVATLHTQNRFCAAPVLLNQYHHQSNPNSRYLLINAGNANAGTGEQGMRTAETCANAVAKVGHVAAEQVLLFSTGVIGEHLNAEKICANIPNLYAGLDNNLWLDAAKAIMTTDTHEKWVSEQHTIDGHTINFTGITKGSGMIEPNMATMLAYIGCDAHFTDTEHLRNLLKQAADNSFNAITVDGDTSTNDSLVCMASGASGLSIDENNEQAFFTALQSVCTQLAQMIIRDAEGATKFVTIDVQGAKDDADAKTVAYTVARSPLVKTALYASDPNWGRILAAVGRSPIDALHIDRVDIHLGDVALIEKGQPAASYTEALGQAEFDKHEININIHLNHGQGSAVIWTSDLSHEYVTINADYRS